MKGARILIVEDERIMAEDLKSRIEQMGAQVLGIASSAEKAFRLVENEIPDLALMDIQIKGKLNGIQTAAILSEKYDIPFIYVTAYADRETLEEIKPTTPHGFILKPFDTDELTAVIETALYKINIEKSMKEQTAWLSSTLKSMGDGLIVTNEAGEVILLNEEAESVTGITLAQARGQNVWSFLRLEDELTHETWNPGDDSSEKEAAVRSLVLNRQDNEMLPVEISYSPLLHADQTITGTVWLIRDVSIRRAAENALKASELKYRQLYESISDAVATVSMDDEFLSFNESFLEMLGYTRDELLGRSSFDITPDEWHDEMRDRRRSQILERGYTDVYEKEFYKKNGERVPVEIRAFLIRDSQGEPQQIWALIRDISQRKAYEQRVQARIERLERHERALIRLLNSDVSIAGELDASFDLIVKETAQALDVESVTLWQYEDHRWLVRHASSQENDASAGTLDVQALPHFWQAIHDTRTLTLHSERDDEVVNEYYAALGPVSEPVIHVHAGVRIRGEVLGMVSCEHRGSMRTWHRDEMAFIAEISDQVAQVLQNRERRETQKALEESERSYRSIFNGTSDGIFIFDAVLHRTVDVNTTFLAMLGQEREQVVDRPLHFFEESGSLSPFFLSELEKAAGQGQTLFKYHFKCGSGISFWAEVTLKPISLSGHPRMMAVVRDITERMENESRQRREQAFRDVVMQMATRFINLPVERVPEGLNDALRQIGEALDYRFCGLFIRQEHCDEAVMLAHWHSRGSDAGICQRRQDEMRKICGAHHEELASGSNLFIDELTYTDEGNVAVVLPLITNNELIGSVLIQSEGGMEFNTRHEMDLLTVFVEMVLSVMIRVDSDTMMRQSENRFRSLFNQSGDAVLILDGTSVVECNDKALSIFKCSRQELLGKTVSDLSPEYQREGFTSARGIEEKLSSVKSGEPLAFEWRHRRFDGHDFDAETSLAYVRTEQADYIQAIIRDVSDRKRTETALRESEARYRNLVEEVPIGIFRAASDGKLLDINPAMIRLLKAARKEALLFLSLGKMHVDEAQWEQWRYQLESEGEVTGVEVRWQSRKGDVIWVRVNARAVKDEAGGLLSIEGTVEEISERKEAEEALIESEERLAQVIYGMTSALFVIDSSHRVIYWNHVCHQLTGVEAKDVVGGNRHWAAFFDEERPILADLILDGAAYEQIRIYYPDGVTPFEPVQGAYSTEGFYPKLGAAGRHLAISAAPLYDRTGQLVGAIESFSDVTEREQTRHDLQASEERFRALTEQSLDTIMRFDLAKRHLYVNPAVKLQTGMDPESFIGKTHEEMGFPPHLVTLWDEALDYVMATGEVHRVDFQLPTGQWIDWQLVPEFNTEGAISAITTSARDMTASKEAAQAVQISEERFRSLSELLPQPVFEITVEGRLTYANLAAFQVFGYPQEDFDTGLFVQNMIAESDHERVEANFASLLAGEKRGPNEYRARRKNGETFPIMIYANQIMEEGRVVGARGIVMDITELRQAESALMQSEEKYRQLVELANDGIAIVTHGIIQYANEPVCQMLSLSREKLIGTPLMDYIQTEYQAEIGQYIALEKEGDTAPALFEARLNTREDGTPVEVNMGPVRYQETLSVLAFIRDVTERVKAQEAVRAAQRAHHLASLGTLAAGISHEINQPLMALKVKVDSMLYWGEENPDLLHRNLLKNLDFISTEADKIDKIIRHMRSLIRMEKVVPTVVDINQTIERAVQLIAQRMASHGIDLKLKLSGRLPTVLTHATSVEQVMVNLLSNAMFALDRIESENKCVEVTTRKSGEECHIIVSDNGPGIPESLLGRIFDPLVTTRDSGDSMGLGLPIVQHLLMKISGDVRVKNKTSGGAQFTVVLPLLKAEGG